MAYIQDPITGHWTWVADGTPGSVPNLPSNAAKITTGSDPATTTGSTPTPTPQPTPTPLSPNQLAWQAALNAQQARRKQLFQQYGLLESGAIDPNNRFGAVRQNLSGYGRQLELAKAAAQAQGFTSRHGFQNAPQRLIRYLLGAQSAALSRNFLTGLGNVDAQIAATQASRPNT